MDQTLLAEQLRLFQEACVRAGLRVTYQRLEIYRELADAMDHPTVEMLHARLIRKIPTLSLDTVYRTMDTLSRHGLIHKVETSASQARFEVVHEHHHHLICSRCAEITDFQWPSMDAMNLPDDLRPWGNIVRCNTVVYGICKRCLKNNDS